MTDVGVQNPPPQTLDELLGRAAALRGLSVGELAGRSGRTLSADPVRSKGRVGELVEQALGASARSLDVPDFPHLGVELKTIPMDRVGRVRESTFVCAIDLGRLQHEEWESSRLWRKLRIVLWVPVQSSDVGPLLARRIGRPLLWRPDAEEESLMRADWTFLIGRMAVGGIEEVSAHLGQVLQVRPKASSGAVRTTVAGPDFEPVRTVPRGFYLRARFTEEVLWRLTD